MQSPSQHDRLAIKREYGLENRLLITTLGMHSPGKRLLYGVRAYARFLYESCTQAQRMSMVYLIAGSYHPEFVRAEGGKLYQEYRATLAQALDYLVFNADKRLAMERRAHRRGHEMRWDNTAWAMLQYIFFLEEELQISTGRGVTFERGKESAFERISGLALV